MRKKAQIIAALLHHPRLFIIDEPTNGLDLDMIILMKKVILTIKRLGITVIVSSHNLNFIEAICDRVCMLREGKVLMEDDIDQILLKTKTDSLESAYSKLSGLNIREDFINDLSDAY